MFKCLSVVEIRVLRDSFFLELFSHTLQNNVVRDSKLGTSLKNQATEKTCSEKSIKLFVLRSMLC